MADQHENQPNRELPPELQAFEAQLASLQPSTGRLERDRLMFEAGKAAAQAERATPTRSATQWAWPAVSTVMTAAAALLLALLVLRPGSKVVNNVPETKDKTSIQKANVPDPAAAPAVPEDFSDPDDQKPDSSKTLLASLFSGAGSPGDESSDTYLRQRDVLLALGGDGLPELKTTPSAKGARSNTRVSYMDLLDELTLETHGFAPSGNRSGELNPLNRGTDL